MGENLNIIMDHKHSFLIISAIRYVNTIVIINPYQGFFLPQKIHFPRAESGQNRNGPSHLETSTLNRCDAIYRHLQRHSSVTYQNKFETNVNYLEGKF